jgi:NDP-sugar pyrophosphorylase family protein
MLNIVIPMAGKGSRFSNVGYKLPKPLIEINGVTMIEMVIKNLTPKKKHKFFFICQRDHLLNYDLESIFYKNCKSYEIISIEKITDGAACTVLLAKEFINNKESLMIANCDQYVDINIDDYLDAELNFDGYIMTMKSNETKWSYINYDKYKNIKGIIEKKVVSNDATVGIYNFSRGELFVQNAEEMIMKNDRVNNEFYVAPVYTYMAKKKFKLGIYDISGKMYGLGTPKDLETFLKKFI